MKIPASTGLLALLAFAPSQSFGQESRIDRTTLAKAVAALAVAEDASNQAKASAAVATRAADVAAKQLDEAKRLMAALTTGVPTPVSKPPAAVDRDPELVTGCPDGAGVITTVAYFRKVGPCERRALADSKVSRFRARSTTGYGTTIVAAPSGASATITLESVTPFRRTFLSVPFPGSSLVEQQRIARQRYAIGVRADASKDDTKFASIATFGELDRLTSKVALFGRYGWDYSTAEEYVFRGGARSDFVEKRAEVLAPKLTEACLKSPGRTCSGIDLVRWLFQGKQKDQGEEFAHPDEIKLYNAVFWGPPPVDPRPAYGWSVRGEVSRPTFDYYPFALTKVPDPFKPGSSKTVIDPAQFPADFASKITKNEDRLNFAVTGRAFWHLSTFRTNNVLSRRARSLSRFAELTSGTTFVGTASYVRADEIEKPFSNVEICPQPAIGQPFVTSQNCTTLNIAAPVRKNSFVLGGEVRQGIDPFWIVPPMLLSARLTHDFSTDENGLAVPLYLGTDLTGTFTSGVRVAHRWGGRTGDGREKKAETLVGIVFGVSLGLDGTTGID